MECSFKQGVFRKWNQSACGLILFAPNALFKGTFHHLSSYLVFKHFLSFILWLDNDVSQTWKRCQILFIYFYKILYIFRRLFQVSFILKVILYFKYHGYAPLSSVKYYFIVARFLTGIWSVSWWWANITKQVYIYEGLACRIMT